MSTAAEDRKNAAKMLHEVANELDLGGAEERDAPSILELARLLHTLVCDKPSARGGTA